MNIAAVLSRSPYQQISVSAKGRGCATPDCNLLTIW